jgi:hypothetical protein
MGRLTNALIFSFFWLLAYVLYNQTAGAGFAFDHIGWLQNYADKGWKGMFTAFDDKSLHYGYHIFGFLAWKLFGLNGTGWMFLFVTLHAVNASLSFVVFKHLFNSIAGFKRTTIAAFTGSVFFVCSPYQTEPVVWYACIHYLFAVLLLMGSSIALFQYLRKKQLLFIGLFYLLFTVALFTLEISFAYPVLLLLFFLFWPPAIFNGSSRFRLIQIFVMPSVVMLFGYFALSYFLRGSAVGHYGAQAHLNFSIPLLMANLAKYISKIYLLSQFWNYEKRQLLFAFFETEKFGWSLFSALSLLAALFLFLRTRLNQRIQAAVLLLCFFAVVLLPILNLFVTFIVNVEGDRFLYFPTLLAYQLGAFALFSLLNYWAVLFVPLFLFYNVQFQQYNIQSWILARDTRNSLLSGFKWWDASRVYLLNNPDNFRGVYMFRCFPPDNLFAETLELSTGKQIEEKVFDTYQYNMITANDSVTVEVVSDNELRVTFTQWGNWWWYKGIGAIPLSNNMFDAEIDEWNHSYKIRFKEKLPGTVYLYQCAGEWRELKGF